jgi:TetR/AcrR family transcriptional repressor of nem operon
VTTGQVKVGRPREFDEGEALDAAMAVFWAKGYHATSLADLMAATGLAKASLYGAFGDKHSLFATVLRRYVDQRVALMAADLGSSRSPAKALLSYLRRQAAEAVGGRGCLSANVALELLPGDDEIGEIVARHQQLTRDLIAGALDRMPKAPPSEVGARFVFAVVEGMWQQGRTLTDPAPLLAAAELTLRALR